MGNSKILDASGVGKREYRQFAEPLDGPSLKRVSGLAKELGVYLLIGFAERQGNACYNAVAVFGPDGKLVHHYRKTHIKGEPYHTEGTEFGLFETPFGRMGTLICYDRQLPEPARILAINGARLCMWTSA